jgi:hypothetical protein
MIKLSNDIKKIIKSYLLKNKYMINFDIFIKNFNFKISLIKNNKFLLSKFENTVFNTWNFFNKIIYIEYMNKNSKFIKKKCNHKISFYIHLFRKSNFRYINMSNFQ